MDIANQIAAEKQKLANQQKQLTEVLGEITKAEQELKRLQEEIKQGRHRRGIKISAGCGLRFTNYGLRFFESMFDA
ncbi:MAG: hypothetical protein R2784_18180 [Saprospiraceae bacterium]